MSRSSYREASLGTMWLANLHSRWAMTQRWELVSCSLLAMLCACSLMHSWLCCRWLLYDCHQRWSSGNTFMHRSQWMLAVVYSARLLNPYILSSMSRTLMMWDFWMSTMRAVSRLASPCQSSVECSRLATLRRATWLQVIMSFDSSGLGKSMNLLGIPLACHTLP